MTSILKTHYALWTPDGKDVLGVKANYIHTIGAKADRFVTEKVGTIASLETPIFHLKLNVLGKGDQLEKEIIKEDRFCISVEIIDSPFSREVAPPFTVILEELPYRFVNENIILPEETRLPHVKYLEFFIEYQVLLHGHPKNKDGLNIDKNHKIFVTDIIRQGSIPRENRILPKLEFEKWPEEYPHRMLLDYDILAYYDSQIISGIYSINPEDVSQYTIYQYLTKLMSKHINQEDDWQDEMINDGESTHFTKERILRPYRISEWWFEYAVNVLGICRENMTLDDLDSVKVLVKAMVKNPYSVILGINERLGSQPINASDIHKSFTHLMKLIDQVNQDLNHFRMHE